MDNLKHIIEEVYAKKENRNKFTFLTGAGISADSGIPTYRGSDGIWVKGTKYHKPEEFGTFKYFLENPREVWQYTLFRKKIFEEAQPNSSHYDIAGIEKLLGDRFHLITQNVDGLHTRSGIENIYEIHGNYREVKCSADCEDIFPLPTILKSKGLKEDLTQEEIENLGCPNCGSWLRPNILWFDEYYNEKTHKYFSSLRVAKRSGILFILGTSGATNLPLEITRTALRYGNYIVDINIEDNKFTTLLEGKKNKITIRKKSSEALSEIKQIIKDCIGKS